MALPRRAQGLCLCEKFSAGLASHSLQMLHGSSSAWCALGHCKGKAKAWLRSWIIALGLTEPEQ